MSLIPVFPDPVSSDRVFLKLSKAIASFLGSLSPVYISSIVFSCSSSVDTFLLLLEDLHEGRE